MKLLCRYCPLPLVRRLGELLSIVSAELCLRPQKNQPTGWLPLPHTPHLSPSHLFFLPAAFLSRHQPSLQLSTQTPSTL